MNMFQVGYDPRYYLILKPCFGFNHFGILAQQLLLPRQCEVEVEAFMDRLPSGNLGVTQTQLSHNGFPMDWCTGGC
jgi:hypothetical protein